MLPMRRFTLCALLCTFSCLAIWAEIDAPFKEHVFVFERNTNRNMVCYDINLQGGSLCKKTPLKVYWVVGGGFRTKGFDYKIEELTFLDRKMAFGVKVINAKEDEALVHLTAYKDLSIRICKHKGKWVGIVKLHGHEMILERMYAQMKPPMCIRCEYVDIYGTDINTGESRCERIIP